MRTNRPRASLVGIVVGALAACALATLHATAVRAQSPHSYTDEEIDKSSAFFEARYDRFNESTSRTLKKPFNLMHDGGKGYPFLVADLKIVSTASDTLMALQILYYAKHWAFLTGEATVLLDDGTRFTLGTEEGHTFTPKRDVERYSIREVVTLWLPCEAVARLAAAKGIDVRLHGDKGNVDVWFPREGISAVRTMRVEAGCLKFEGD